MKAKAEFGHIAYVKIALSISIPKHYKNAGLESGIKRGITETLDPEEQSLFHVGVRYKKHPSFGTS